MCYGQGNQPSAQAYFINSKNKELSIEQRIKFIDSAITVSNADSTTLKYISYKSSIYSKQRDFDKALITANELLQTAKERNSLFYIAKAQFKLGLYYAKLNQFEKSYNWYFKSSMTYEKLEDYFNFSKCLLRLSMLQHNNGNFIQSEELITKALKRLPKNEIKLRFDFYYQLAYSSLELADKNSVNHWGNESLKNAQTAIDSSLVYNLYGLLAHEDSKYIKALDYYNKALSFRNIYNERHQLMIQSNKALSNAMLDDRSSIDELNRIISEKQELSSDVLTYASLIHLSKTYTHFKELDKAAVVLNKAYTIAEDISSKEAQQESLGLLIDIDKANSFQIRHYKTTTEQLEKNRTQLTRTFDKINLQTEQAINNNLQLKAEKAEQEVLLAQENKRKWQLGGGLGASLIGLGIFGFYYRRNKKQKELIESLQKELHHRVKNNLSIIDTFIEVAKEEFDDLKFTDKLTELQNRIDSINEVHQQLYQKEDVTNLNLKEYIKTLSDNVSSSFSNERIIIENDINDTIEIQADRSFSIGLIINEFLTNSFKYGFETEEKGLVKIKVQEDKTSYQLYLSDNGKGLPEGFDIEQLESFGLRIIKLLSQQLDGSFELRNENGVHLDVTFPK
ncbi:sensory transduction histidine kinase [Nonlabens dokdonensis DSW-6]|uniref:histidine kinase n=1 Tax=Nonlabens dokdonensis (strain DSM 17205 / KCTC 12402 / DSW-6) TaxID=592029 RepID=L7WBH8_NONDD|nr:sensory transduction histidine kinase [Nonlabens dokdonensis DSW-6]